MTRKRRPELLSVEHWPIARFRPYDRNPRKNDHAVEAMVRLIRSYGFRIPMIVRSDGEIVDGHLRLKAAVALKLKTLPVILADDMTPAQIRAFRISVNRASDLADWDEDLLREEIAALADLGIDLTDTGFGPDDIERFLADVPEPTPQAHDPPESEVLIEIRCSRAALDELRETLNAWSERDGLTIDIS